MNQTYSQQMTANTLSQPSNHYQTTQGPISTMTQPTYAQQGPTQMTQNQQQTQWNPSTNQSWATGLL
jgi:hypothetical protein